MEAWHENPYPIPIFAPTVKKVVVVVSANSNRTQQ